jgi:hypothetical protein
VGGNMKTWNRRRVMDLALVLCAMATITACAPHSQTSNDLRVTYPLVVNNRSDFEVVIYSMASATTRGMRLGTARPFATTTLSVPAYALHSQDVLSVQLHAIGAARTVANWTSAGTVLRENLMAQLDIAGDLAGNLRMSHLSSRVARPIR